MIGQWRNDAMHGKGKYYWDNGDSWEGQFNMNQFYGKVNKYINIESRQRMVGNVSQLDR